MDSGEFLTRATIWISMLGYGVGSVIFALSSSTRRRVEWEPAARVVWTIACASLIAHFISAFQFYHAWSHTAAYIDTARQTEELFGLNWGGGLFINYALLIAWLVDIAWWWRSGIDSYRKRPRLLVALWHGLFIFIIFNATVVFADGIARWVGLAISLLLTVTWLRILREWDRPLDNRGWY
jgi:MFS family permease